MRVASWRTSGGSDSRANRAIASKTAQSRWCAAVGRLLADDRHSYSKSAPRFRFLSGKRPLSILEEPQIGPHSRCAPGSDSRQAPLLSPSSGGSALTDWRSICRHRLEFYVRGLGGDRDLRMSPHSRAGQIRSGDPSGKNWVSARSASIRQGCRNAGMSKNAVIEIIMRV